MLSAIQAYLRKVTTHDRIVENIGPFLATVSPDTDNLYLNYAIPDDGAQPTPSDVKALIAFYQAHNRTPRLEYSATLAPAVETALAAEGFTVELLSPLMVYPPDQVNETPMPPGIELLLPRSDDEILGMMDAQSEAYGGSPVERTPEVAEKHRAFYKAGGLSVLAREMATGEAAGAGGCTIPFDRTTELAGIGVRPRFHRRGIACAMTAWLAQQANAAGTTTVFLMAAGEAEARIYARAGFQQIGHMLHISRR